MRWRDLRRSSNVEDRRGQGGGFGGGFGRGGLGGGFGRGGGGGLRVGGAGGLGLVVVIVLALLFGFNPGDMLDGGGDSGTQVSQGVGSDEEAQFVAAVLGNTEDTWRAIFRSAGESYQDPTLVLFSGSVNSACGYASAAVGPFYCPGDHKVYLDLSFFRELASRFGAPGDFAQAYVIAHEVGHHVQTLLGIMDRVNQQRSGLGEADANALSVRVELQADCFAGVWAYHADRDNDILEPGDIEEGLQAASAVGDDTLQRRSQGYVVPESFTHGTAEQRMSWFRRGFEKGDPNACDTFSAKQL